jgi:hypothetical protein
VDELDDEEQSRVNDRNEPWVRDGCPTAAGVRAMFDAVDAVKRRREVLRIRREIRDRKSSDD